MNYNLQVFANIQEKGIRKITLLKLHMLLNSIFFLLLLAADNKDFKSIGTIPMNSLPSPAPPSPTKIPSCSPLALTNALLRSSAAPASVAAFATMLTAPTRTTPSVETSLPIPVEVHLGFLTSPREMDLGLQIPIAISPLHTLMKLTIGPPWRNLLGVWKEGEGQKRVFRFIVVRWWIWQLGFEWKDLCHLKGGDSAPTAMGLSERERLLGSAIVAAWSPTIGTKRRVSPMLVARVLVLVLVGGRSSEAPMKILYKWQCQFSKNQC